MAIQVLKNMTVKVKNSIGDDESRKTNKERNHELQINHKKKLRMKHKEEKLWQI